MAAAPTVPFSLPRKAPRRLLQKLLAGFGDRSLIRGYVSGDGDATYLHLQPRARRAGARAVRIGWEQTIVAGAFRDLLCAARAPLLWSWTGMNGGPLPMLDQTYPYLQRFPSPSERVFRERLAVAGRRWHFRVLDARYLRRFPGHGVRKPVGTLGSPAPVPARLVSDRSRTCPRSAGPRPRPAGMLRRCAAARRR
jgi:hypothetical protein